MLDAWIIDWLKREEERKRQEQQRPTIQPEQPKPPAPEGCG